jgi:hypothetical protein
MNDRLAAACREALGDIASVHTDATGPADDELVDAIRLGLAWQACENALPEGGLLSVEQREDPIHGGVFYSAVVLGTAEPLEGNERTPAAALDKLRAALDNR